jgi:hypothetical protein
VHLEESGRYAQWGSDPLFIKVGDRSPSPTTVARDFVPLSFLLGLFALSARRPDSDNDVAIPAPPSGTPPGNGVIGNPITPVVGNEG